MPWARGARDRRHRVTGNDLAPDFTHAFQPDAADEAALRAVGAGHFEHSNFGHLHQRRAEHLRDHGAQEAWRAQRGRHSGSPLQGPSSSGGRDRVVYPEQEIGGASRTRSASTTSWTPRRGPPVRMSRSLFGRRRRSWAVVPRLDLANRLRLTPNGLRRGEDVPVNPHRDERTAPTRADPVGMDARLRGLRTKSCAPRRSLGLRPRAPPCRYRRKWYLAGACFGYHVDRPTVSRSGRRRNEDDEQSRPASRAGAPPSGSSTRRPRLLDPRVPRLCR